MPSNNYLLQPFPPLYEALGQSLRFKVEGSQIRARTSVGHSVTSWPKHKGQHLSAEEIEGYMLAWTQGLYSQYPAGRSLFNQSYA